MSSSPLPWAAYRLLAATALSLVAPWMALRGLGDRRWRECLRGRLARPIPRGSPPPPPPGESPRGGGGRPLWLHAVSVGEVLAARAVVERLRREAPHLPLLVSASTPTGYRLAGEILPPGVSRRWFPFDASGPVERALAESAPALVAVMETEIWPWFFRSCRERGIPLAVINGRMSERSARRYRRLGRLLRESLGGVALGLFQTAADRERFVSLGLPAERALVLGNLKYDLDNLEALTRSRREGAELVAGWRRPPGGGEPRPLVVAGSTKPGEERLILEALRPLMAERPGLLLLLAPRHPPRFDEVARLLEGCGLPFQRRSRLGPQRPPDEACRILLLDTLGELAAVYAECTAAFVGGSLVPEGGHNILEPAFFGRPVLFGRYMENFAELAGLFLRRGAAVRLASAADLAPAVRRLLEEPGTAGEMGRRGRAILEENQGAAAATARQLLQLAGLAPKGAAPSAAPGSAGGPAVTALSSAATTPAGRGTTAAPSTTRRTAAEPSAAPGAPGPPAAEGQC